MFKYLDLYILKFALALIISQVLYLLIYRILVNKNEEEDVPGYRYSLTVIIYFIRIIRTTANTGERILYLFMLVSMVLISLYAVVVFVKGAHVWFEN